MFLIKIKICNLKIKLCKPKISCRFVFFFVFFIIFEPELKSALIYSGAI